jgi:hypothetical protein
MSPSPEQSRPWWQPAFPLKIAIATVIFLMLYLLLWHPWLLAGLGVSVAIVLAILLIAIAVHKWCRLRYATIGFAVVMAGIVLLANLPGQNVLKLKLQEDAYLYPYFEHGWPVAYLSRKLPYSRESPESCWQLTGGVESFSAGPLCLDLLMGACGVALATLGFDYWQRNRRTGWRLSLAEAFGLMTAIAGVCIWIGYEKRAFDAEQLAIQEIQALTEGHAQFKYHRRGPTFLHELMGDNTFRFLDRVAASESINDHPIFAGRFPYLTTLQRPSLGPEEIASISKLRRLKALDLFGTHEIKESAQHPGQSCLTDLPPMPSLQYFAATVELSEGELDWLAKCSSLAHIDLYRSENNADLARLKGLTNLQSATLPCSEPFAEETLEFISQWKNLRSLFLEGRVTGEGLAHLKHLKKLRVLGLSGYNCGISDLEISELEQMTQLEELRVSKDVLPDSSIQYLQKALPQTRFSRPLGTEGFMNYVPR